jgi:hypothetical protein
MDGLSYVCNEKYGLHWNFFVGASSAASHGRALSPIPAEWARKNRSRPSIRGILSVFNVAADERLAEGGDVADPHVLLGQAIVRLMGVGDDLLGAGEGIVGGEDSGR